MLKSNLLATKLHRPSLPAKWVSRPHLSQRLHEGLEFNRQITLVSAPAGFGKTTCISEWINTLGHWPVSWLSLDSADDDPGRFFDYFIAALQQVDVNLGREIEGVLRSGQLPPAEIISTTLINDILELEGRFLLVLDDFHVIQDRFILQVLEQMVANLPPPLHLVLLTREDPPLPLAQLRANNRLTEIRARDLRFTGDDTGRFLNEVMSLSLSPADIATVEDKTEGWIVGLQLAGLSIHNRANPSNFIATLSGSHRFILNYLTEQVLSRQPEEIQHFLLQTSILNKLNGDLCNAVTGRSDGRALLERLFNANLFLIPLNDEQQWYRYHHLFADLLRDRQNVLQKDKIADLHRRASRWYAGAGGETSLRWGEPKMFVSEAIRHALAAQDYALAVDLLEKHASGMILQGYVKTVNGWVQILPAEWRLQSPRIDLAFAWMHMLRGSPVEADPYLEHLRATLGDYRVEPYQLAEENPALYAEWLVIQSLMLYSQAEAADSKTLAIRALEIAPEQDSRVRSLAYWGLASACQLLGDFSQAVEAYQQAIRHSRVAENLVAEMMSTIGLAELALEHGQLHLAFDIASQAVERIERSGMLPPISAVVYGALGDAYYQWYQLDEARNHTVRAFQLSTLGGYNTGVIFCRALLSRLLHIEGNLEAAADEIEKAVDLVPVEAPDYVWQEVVAYQVRVYLAQNRIAMAQMALQGQSFSYQREFSFPALPADQSISYSIGLLYNSSLRVLLHQAQTRNDPASLRPGLALANHLIADASRDQQLLIALEALLLRAQMHAILGDQQASHADYVRALELAEPEGFIGIFVEQGPPVAEALANLVKQNRLGTVQRGYIERVLAAFSPVQPVDSEQTGETRLSPSVEAAALIEPLTDRELEVLRLMAGGLKYKEIATKLFISVNTVRFHVKAIYGKFNVNNRTQAIAAARQLQIL